MKKNTNKLITVLQNQNGTNRPMVYDKNFLKIRPNTSSEQLEHVWLMQRLWEITYYSSQNT